VRVAGAAATLTRPLPEPATAQVRVLPAGIYFRHHTYRPCAHVDERQQAASGLCTDPKAAIVTGVFATERDAQRALDHARTLDLAPGYPFAAHSDELGLVDTKRVGTAIVIGLFEHASGARAWLADRPIAGAEHVGLLDADTAFARHEERRRFAVMIDSSTPVPAYAARLFQWSDDQEPEGVVRGKTRPLCEIRPGALFVTDAEALQSVWYDWAPVRCGRELAYVEWTKTRLTATIWRRQDRTTELLQIVEVSCDSPTFQAWSLHGNRRIAGEDDLALATSPCGG
jgi:hypothetical protein